MLTTGDDDRDGMKAVAIVRKMITITTTDGLRVFR
jgi:hypothetical protein